MTPLPEPKKGESSAGCAGGDRLAAWITRQLAEAPELDGEQTGRLRALLPGAGDARTRGPASSRST